jgi:phage/plasmid-like protein (TIGR03299 family)
MAHALDMSNGRANIAFMGSRNDIWHRMGQEMLPGQTITEWASAAGLGWNAIKVPAIASLEGAQFDHLEPGQRFQKVQDRAFIARSDTGSILGFVSGETAADGYQLVQPADVLDWFQRYISVDDRFALDVCGSLDGGKRIWATARYNGSIDIAGEAHAARVLMSTTFDATGATINQCTMTRVVCQNTLRMAHADNRAAIRTRHSTRFDAAKVGKELSQLASGFAQYKAIGDALGQVEFAKDAVADFFKDCLDIPRNAQRSDISTRKANQFQDLGIAYRKSVQEGAANGSAWAALQAITRYADHERSVRSGDTSESVARFASSQFGSGDALKGKAMGLLMPLIKDRVAIAA